VVIAIGLLGQLFRRRRGVEGVRAGQYRAENGPVEHAVHLGSPRRRQGCNMMGDIRMEEAKGFFGRHRDRLPRLVRNQRPHVLFM